MTEIAQTNTRTVDRMQVRIEHLDKLLSLAGEVIITSANLQDLERQVQQAVTRRETVNNESLQVIKTSNEATRRISQDLHDLVMAIRLVEIAETMRMFRRPVRDLARSLGRDVELVFEGTETMIDKALAERLVDPILHLLRNAVDHGMETPLERSRAGKPPQGRITVSAEDRESVTRIRICDDGRGIDTEAVTAKAEEMGLTGRNESAQLWELLCRPGLTTASLVTATSGRGVGLDLVQTVVAEFGGTVQVETTPGEGSTFTLDIPKLRAVNIVDALTLRAGGRLFALPIEQTVASLGILPSEIRSALHRGTYILHQGQAVILRDLQDLLGDGPLCDNHDLLPVVIVESKGRKLALIISEFLGPQKLVNIQIDDILSHSRGVAGTSVFTGGRLGLTLNVDELADFAMGRTQPAAPQGQILSEGPGAPCDTKPDETDTGGGTDTGKWRAESTVHGDARSAPDGQQLDRGDVADLRDELRQSVRALQDALLSLEATPEDDSRMNEAFRRLHAAKGNLTMLDALKTADFAHHLETVLDYHRSGRLPLTPERTDLLLDCVAHLAKAADLVPESDPDAPAALLDQLRLQTRPEVPDDPDRTQVDLLGCTFELSPTEELQVLCALKKGERTYESYVAFDSGRQADFLIAYLILRRIGMHGNVLATIPSVSEIEEGNCSNAFKLLWSSPLDEEGLKDLIDALSAQYCVQEFSSIPTTVFQYEKAA